MFTDIRSLQGYYPPLSGIMMLPIIRSDGILALQLPKWLKMATWSGISIVFWRWKHESIPRICPRRAVGARKYGLAGRSAVIGWTFQPLLLNQTQYTVYIFIVDTNNLIKLNKALYFFIIITEGWSRKTPKQLLVSSVLTF